MKRFSDIEPPPIGDIAALAELERFSSSLEEFRHYATRQGLSNTLIVDEIGEVITKPVRKFFRKVFSNMDEFATEMANTLAGLISSQEANGDIVEDFHTARLRQWAVLEHPTPPEMHPSTPSAWLVEKVFSAHDADELADLAEEISANTHHAFALLLAIDRPMITPEHLETFLTALEWIKIDEPSLIQPATSVLTRLCHHGDPSIRELAYSASRCLGPSRRRGILSEARARETDPTAIRALQNEFRRLDTEDATHR